MIFIFYLDDRDNSLSKYFVTPLILAAEHGYDSMVKILVKYGANIDKTIERTNTNGVYHSIHRTIIHHFFTRAFIFIFC